MKEAKVKIGDQWFNRGNRSNTWFATFREDGGLADRVPSLCWPFLEEIVRLRDVQRDAVIEECAQVVNAKFNDLAKRSYPPPSIFLEMVDAIRAIKSPASSTQVDRPE